MRLSTLLVALMATALSVAPAAEAQKPERKDVPRTPSGKPDFSGTYDVATLTPMERPEAYGDRLFLSETEAQQIAEREREFVAKANSGTDPNREAPPEGGAPLVGWEENRVEGELLGAGNVGGYNTFWMDRGKEAFSIDGKFRTSILTDPPNGRMPDMHPDKAKAFEKYFSNFLRNDGTAWWLAEEGPGPYDNIEDRPASERCLLGFNSGPPMNPSLYNNLITVVQTDDYVVIVNEMIHDARIVRIGGEHISQDVRKWMGDSIGRWDGDTLIVETTNFRNETGLDGASRTLKVIERFTPLDGDHAVYEFTVDDPGVWSAPWTGDYVWPKTDKKMYEYACHEGNYSLHGIMKGARMLEADWKK